MSRLSSFLDGAPDGTRETLAALACAESLTDQVALEICRLVPVRFLSPEDFVAGFKYCGLTEPRNSEWNLAPALREELVLGNILPQQASRRVHAYLLSLGQAEENRRRAGSEIPSYLFTDAGQAYHLAGTGDVESALKRYSATWQAPFNGAQWLGAKLAAEQERTKAIPPGAIETTFLRAWVMLRQNHRAEAMPLFRKIAATDRVMLEVAISLHIVGNDNNRGQRAQAEQELRRSIEIRKALGDEFGIAQTLHSLANLLSRQNGRHKEAEEVYRESIKIGTDLRKYPLIAQILHSLANLLSQQEGRRKEAEETYDKSIRTSTEYGDFYTAAQALHSLANLLSRQNGRHKDAEEAYRESIKIDDSLGNEFGVAQALHSLANLLSQQNGRHKEAEELYRKSIEIDDTLDNKFGVAQTLHGLANLLSREDGRIGEAEQAYERSLALWQSNDNHRAQVLRSYGLALAPHSPDRALALLEQSLDINRRRGNRRFITMLERDIRDLKARMGRT